jgi:hypothetical protein
LASKDKQTGRAVIALKCTARKGVLRPELARIGTPVLPFSDFLREAYFGVLFHLEETLLWNDGIKDFYSHPQLPFTPMGESPNGCGSTIGSGGFASRARHIQEGGRYQQGQHRHQRREFR